MILEDSILRVQKAITSGGLIESNFLQEADRMQEINVADDFAELVVSAVNSCVLESGPVTTHQHLVQRLGPYFDQCLLVLCVDQPGRNRLLRQPHLVEGQG